MRAINADALIKFIENRYDITWKDDYEGGIKDACTDILEEINKMPTIEPERKKGKWIHGREMAREMIRDCITAIFYEGWTCSECGYLVEKEREPWYKYCPNCGSCNGGDKDDQR